MSNRPILLAAVGLAGALFLAGPFFVSAEILTQGTAQSPYFELRYGKDQEEVVVRAIPLQRLSKEVMTTVTPSSVALNTLLQYDTQLPYVSYKTQSATEFHRRLEGQIAQTLAKKNYRKAALTPAQLIEVTGEVVATTMNYDYRMVSKDARYDLAHDDYISALPLDVVFLKEKSGVCRQYAALFEYIGEYVRDWSGASAVAGLEIDEVISQEDRHAYNVVLLPQSDHSLSLAFIDPIVMKPGKILKTGDALGQNHDSLFSEFAKSPRWQWARGERLSMLEAVETYRQQGDKTLVQVARERQMMAAISVVLAP